MSNKIICIVLTILCGNALNAQNIGIHTATPQATLDVRGSMRFGGSTNYLKYDSATGKFEWIGSSLFMPISQQIISHSASSEGLYAGGGKLEYRNHLGNPVFFSDWTNGNVHISGGLGVGIITPQHKLHLFNGASGSTPPFGYNLLALESSGNINMSFLTPDANESTIWFSKPSKPLGGGIFYNNPVAPDGFVFMANNAPRMAITNTGKIGIGLNSPVTKLHLYDGGSGATPFTFSRLAVESDGHTYINLLSPAMNETAILFGKAGNAASGVIMYNNDDNPNGFQFRNNGNLTRMVINNAGNVGIGVTNPLYPLDINGRIRLSGNSPFTAGVWLSEAGIERSFVGLENNSQVGFYGADGGIGWGLTMNTQTGALKVNGREGNPGQVLQSNGSSTAPTWASSTNTLYNNTSMFTLAAPLTTLDGAPATLIPGFDYTFAVAGNAKALVSFTLEASSNLCAFCGASSSLIDLYLNSDLKVRYRWDIANNSITELTGSYVLSVGAGTHRIRLFARSFGPSVQFISGATIATNMIVQVIPQ